MNIKRKSKISRKERRKNQRKGKKIKRFKKQRGINKSNFQAGTNTNINNLNFTKDISISSDDNLCQDNNSTILPDLDSACKFAEQIIQPKKIKNSPNFKSDITKKTKANKIDIFNKNSDSKDTVTKNSTEPKLKIEKYIPKFRLKLLNENVSNSSFNQIRGIVNKVTSTNIESQSKKLLSLYNEYSNNEVNENIIKTIQNVMFLDTQFSDTLAIYMAALLTAVHIDKLEFYFGVFFMEKLVNRFAEHHRQKDSLKAQKLMLLIVYSYCFQVAHRVLIKDILQLLAKDLDEFNVNLLLLCLKESGPKLRKEDPKFFKDFFRDFQEKIDRKKEVKISARHQCLLEFVMDLKTNKNAVERDEVRRLKKWVANLVNKKGISHYSDRVICVGLKAFLRENKTGRWWLDMELGDAKETSDSDNKSDEKSILSHIDEELVKTLWKKSKKFDFGSCRRKTIFCLVVSSNSSEEAFKNLKKLFSANSLKKFDSDSSVKGINGIERDTCHVIFHCCLKEKTFNPFYCELLKLFLAYRRGFSYTLKLLFLQKFKEMETKVAIDKTGVDISNPTRIKNASKLLAFLISENLFCLSFLKKIKFDFIGEIASLFLCTLFNQILTDCDVKKVASVYAKINTDVNSVLCENLLDFHETNKDRICGRKEESFGTKRVLGNFGVAINSLN